MNATRTPPAPREGRPDEQILYGWNACWAVFTYRAHDILRVYHHKDRRREAAPLLKWAAGRRIPYRELDGAGMRRLAGTPHHEGLALTVRPLRYSPWNGERPEGDEVWLALDNVENPYNVGAMLRTAAFFGVDTVLVGGIAAGEKVNAAATRAAEGGAESVRLRAAPDLAETLDVLAETGIAVTGLETDAERALGRESAAGPAVLVAGHERSGLSEPVRRACTALRGITGAGAVASLNVSVAVGIALADFHRPTGNTPPGGSSRSQGASRKPAAEASRSSPSAPADPGPAGATRAKTPRTKPPKRSKRRPRTAKTGPKGKPARK